jgi:hypothetical protein
MSDIAKIAAALERPGIDPRKFVDLGVVTAVAVGADGVHADIETINNLPETVSLAPPYSGSGFGLYLPLDVDDLVVLAVPDGMFNAGGRIVGRTWDAGTPPPPEVVDHPEDVALVVKPGQTIRIVVSGGGNVVVEARDDGQVRLGAEDATQKALLGDEVLSRLGTLVSQIATAVGGIVATAGVAPVGTAAGTAISAALASFQAAVSTYTSMTVRLK